MTDTKKNILSICRDVAKQSTNAQFIIHTDRETYTALEFTNNEIIEIDGNCFSGEITSRTIISEEKALEIISNKIRCDYFVEFKLQNLLCNKIANYSDLLPLDKDILKQLKSIYKNLLNH